jgi:tetratricopeptide (TPR) repeat protein
MKSSLTILTGFLFSLFLMFSVARAGAQSNPDDQPHIQPRATPTPTPAPEPTPGPNEAAPQSQPYRPPFPGDPEPSGGGGDESSSKDSQIDLGAHPVLAEPAHAEADPSVFVPFDPHRAAKDDEIGQYYLKQKNYRAALDRFHDALLYKPNDAEAMYGLGVTQEKLDLLDLADQSYRKYLQILPNGPKSSDAQEALKRISPHLAAKTVAGDVDQAKQAAHDMEVGETYLSINKYDAARERFEEALRLAPENSLVYFRLAQSLQGMQRLDPARLYYRKYLELEPKGRFAGDARKAIRDIDFIMGK